MKRATIKRAKKRLQPAAPAARLRTILVPTDFSEHSRGAAQYAVFVAKRFRAKLILLYVIHPQYYTTNLEYMAFDYASLLEETRRTAETELAEFAGSIPLQGVPFQARIMEGHPGQCIVEHAKKCGADLIVNATHGRTGLAHVLLGSTAEHVVRFGKCPVLVVPRSLAAKTKRTNRK